MRWGVVASGSVTVTAMKPPAWITKNSSSMVNAAARVMDSSLTKEERAQLVIDTKHMAERKGEIKAQLPQLESDLESYQRELDDYRSTLRYVE